MTTETEPMVKVMGARCGGCGRTWDEWRDEFDAPPEPMPVIKAFRMVQVPTYHSDCFGQILFELEPAA